MKYYLGGISASLLLVFSIFTLFSITEVNAEEEISVNPIGYENTIVVELENNSDSKIKTIRMWAGGELTFESFKSEPGWGGGKYSDGKLIIFTATNALNPGKSVKFGLVTSEKIDGINWKVLDQNDNEIDAGKTSIDVISKTDSVFIEEETKEVEEAKKEGNKLYGSKQFIPEKIRVGADVRLVGNGFEPNQDFKLYLDNSMLKSISTDSKGNFLTTISISDTEDTGNAEFIIKSDDGKIQTTNINIEEAKNRFVKTTQFEVNSIPAEIRYQDTLTISGNASPQSAVVLAFESADRILEKVRVSIPNANGEWIFEEVIQRDELVGEKFVIIKNNHDKTTKNLKIKSDYLVEISTSNLRFNAGESVTIIGNGEPNQKTTLWIKDRVGKIILYDVYTSKNDGDLKYEFVTASDLPAGTYTAIVKQENGSDATLFGIGKYPSNVIVALVEQPNFTLNSKAMLSIVGSPSSKVSIKILDSNDNIKKTHSIITNSDGKSRYAVDLDGLSSGIYRAVVSSSNIQDSVKFSIGLEAGSGSISLISTVLNYSPGQSILVLGSTGVDSRITVTLYDPSGNISSVTETFSDGAGNFSTNEIGIPTDATFGEWKVTAHSRLESTSITINVSLPVENTLMLELENNEFSPGDTILIKGLAKSDTTRLSIEIINLNGETIAELETPITSDDTFLLPWQIPQNIDSGTFTIIISDGENINRSDIFIQ